MPVLPALQISTSASGTPHLSALGVRKPSMGTRKASAGGALFREPFVDGGDVALDSVLFVPPAIGGAAPADDGEHDGDGDAGDYVGGPGHFFRRGVGIDGGVCG